MQFTSSAISLFATLTMLAAEPPPKFTLSPTSESPEIKSLIDSAQSALQSGRTVSELLMDSAFMPAHSHTRFRELIRNSASEGPVTLTTASEPGDLLQVRGTIRDGAGRPMKKVLVYAYHTSSKGWYSDKAVHFQGQGGDDDHARLFGYMRTDADGRFEFRTIRPAGYADAELPSHIHFTLASADGKQSLVTEIQFDDDPKLTANFRDHSRKNGFVICKVGCTDPKLQRVTADFTLR